MPKLNKMYYYTPKGERKLNCYRIIIPKEEVLKANINDTDELKVVARDGKLIIEKEEQEQ